MHFEVLTNEAVQLVRHLFKEQGHLHAMALLDAGQGNNLGLFDIPESKDTNDAVGEFNAVIRENNVRAYAAAYEVILNGSQEEQKMFDEGHRALDQVGPKEQPSLAEIMNFDPTGLPEKAVIIVIASADGDKRTLFLPVIGPNKLGDEQDVTDEMHSPFAEVFDAPGSRGPRG